MPPKQRATKSPLSSLLEKINTICVLCAQSTEAQSMLNDSLQKTLELLRAGRGSIFILDPLTKELVLKASKGLKVDEKNNLVKYLGKGIIGQVAQLKEPMLVENIST